MSWNYISNKCHSKSFDIGKNYWHAHWSEFGLHVKLRGKGSRSYTEIRSIYCTSRNEATVSLKSYNSSTKPYTLNLTSTYTYVLSVTKITKVRPSLCNLGINILCMPRHMRLKVYFVRQIYFVENNCITLSFRAYNPRVLSYSFEMFSV